MDSTPFALSVHHFVSSVGADAGFAALIGLALVILLYFSHARETATLRTRADDAELRVQDLEAQLADLADQVAALPAEISVRAASPRAAAAYGGATAGGMAAAAGVGAAAGAGAAGFLPPAAPAGVGGPALSAATRLIPMPESLVPAPPMPDYEPATAAGGANGSSPPVVAASSATIQRSTPAPAGRSARPPAAPVRAGAGAGAGRAGGGPGRAETTPGRAAGAPRAAGPVRPAPRRSRTGRVLAAIALTLVVAGAVAVGVVVLTHHHSPSTNHATATGALAGRRTGSVGALQPSTVTVSVLNGTDLSGLATRVSQRLAAVGYRKGAVSNAPDQTHTSSVVEYMAPAERRDALAVATTLKLAPTSVQPIDPTTKAIACPPSQACTSAVVVTVGSNLANQ